MLLTSTKPTKLLIAFLLLHNMPSIVPSIKHLEFCLALLFSTVICYCPFQLFPTPPFFAKGNKMLLIKMLSTKIAVAKPMNTMLVITLLFLPTSLVLSIQEPLVVLLLLLKSTPMEPSPSSETTSKLLKESTFDESSLTTVANFMRRRRV